MITSSNELRVFISSTFRDLQEERGYLAKHIFPEIRAMCREQGVTFTEVDLRWGLTEESTALGQVIRTCLDEVDRCRPHFIGMLGSRYGWIPESHEILMDPDLLARFPWVEDLAAEGTSLTEMEFVHGVFNAPNPEAKFAFFYRRSGDLSNADHPERLQSLIERAQATSYPFREFGNVETLGEMVRDDLRQVVETTWPESEAPTPLELEHRAHRAFAANRRRAFIPQSDYLTEFGQWMNSGETPLVIRGESGLGKSALIAYLTENRRSRHPETFVIEHYVGTSPASGPAQTVIRHILEEIRCEFGIEEDLPDSREQIVRAFPNWLFRLEHLARERNRPVLIAIDALNQLGEIDRRLDWLPERIPPGIRLMVSTTPGETDNQLDKRGWQRLTVNRLEDDRIRRSIVVRYLREFRKGVSVEQLGRLIRDSKASSPLFLRVVAEELRLRVTYDELDREISRFVDAEDIDDVFQFVLERLEGDHGAENVGRTLSALWVSRGGLSENDLLEITGPKRLELSRMLLALDYHLIRGDGLLGFFHDFLRHAVELRYLPDEPSKRARRLSLGRYFDTQPLTERTALELLRQYSSSGEDELLIAALCRIDVLLALWKGSGRTEVLENWSRLQNNGHAVDEAYRSAIAGLTASVSEEGLEGHIAVGELLVELGRWETALTAYRSAIGIARERRYDRQRARANILLGELLARRGEFKEATERVMRGRRLYEELGDRRETAGAIGTMGMVYLHQNRFDLALESCRQLLEISNESDDMAGVATAERGIGAACFRLGRYDEALESYRRELAIHELPGNRHGTGIAVANIGNVFYKRCRFDRALELYDRQLTICRELGDPYGVALSLGNISNIHARLGEFGPALEYREQQLAISGELGYRAGMALATGSMGIIHFDSGNYDRAMELLVQAVYMAREIGFPFGLAYWLLGQANVLLKCREVSPAPQWLTEYVSPEEDESAYETLLREARKLAAEAVTVSTGMSQADSLFLCRIALAQIDAADGRREAAVQTLQEMLEGIVPPSTSGEDPSFDDTDEQRCELYYRLWKIDGSVDAGTEALQLFRRGLSLSPQHNYRKRIDELEAEIEEAG